MKWLVSFLRLRKNGYRYKVTRRLPELSLSETKFFRTKKQAEEQVQQWLNEVQQ